MHVGMGGAKRKRERKKEESLVNSKRARGRRSANKMYDKD